VPVRRRERTTIGFGSLRAFSSRIVEIAMQEYSHLTRYTSIMKVNFAFHLAGIAGGIS
jgi:hypothetical protein